MAVCDGGGGGKGGERRVKYLFSSSYIANS